MEYRACAIAGHRPARFKWKYNENNNGCKRLQRRVREQLVQLYEKGTRRFYIGGNLGVDLWAGELLLALKEQPEYSEIELALVLPYPRHDKDWDKLSRHRLSKLRQHSAEVIIAGTSENPPAVNYKLRDQYMVEHSNYLLAVYDNAPDNHYSVDKVVNYSRKKKLGITLIHPDSAQVSYENQILCNQRGV